MAQQNGSARTLLIIGLIAVLIATVGFVLWQNFSKTNNQADNSSVSTAKKDVNTNNEETSLLVKEDAYSFAVPKGFYEETEQQFTYTASLKAKKTFVNDQGDYFEVLLPVGGGGGMSSDYSWSYDVTNDGKLSVAKSELCTENVVGCAINNTSVEGVISNKNNKDAYVLAFGNKVKNETDLVFVDEFLSTFRFN